MSFVRWADYQSIIRFGTAALFRVVAKADSIGHRISPSVVDLLGQVLQHADQAPKQTTEQEEQRQHHFEKP